MASIQTYTSGFESIEEIYNSLENGETVSFIARLINSNESFEAEYDTTTEELVVRRETDNTTLRYSQPNSPTDLHEKFEFAAEY